MTSPAAYLVAKDRMIVLANLSKSSDWDFPEDRTIDSYFGGVYIQVDYVNGGDSPDEPS